MSGVNQVIPKINFSEQCVNILKNYKNENPGVLRNLSILLQSGNLANTGYLMILAVDQGIEHGPYKAFTIEEGIDPIYHAQLALETGCSGISGSLGFLEDIANPLMGRLPMILKLNHNYNILNLGDEDDLALCATVKDALRLGCVGVGFTLYPGSKSSFKQMETLREIIREAKEYGLLVVTWVYPRGQLVQESRTNPHILSHGVYMAFSLGSHIVKVKYPSGGDTAKVVKAGFNGKKIVLFSGGEMLDDKALINQTQSIIDGNGHGTIMGRNLFQRPKDEAIKLSNSLTELYKQAFIKK